ncbi:MAG: hypothetical protein ABSF81_00840 [Bacteroidales bacterium]
MEEIRNLKYQELSIQKVIISIKKYNRKGIISREAKLSTVEKYFKNGYLSERVDFYANEKDIKAKFLFDLEKKTLEKIHYNLDRDIEYKCLWKYDENDRLIEEGKFHFNYIISPGKPVLGRNWRGQYDDNGNLVSSIQYSHGHDVEEVFNFKYDKNGKLIEKMSKNYKWEYFYNQRDLLNKIVRKELFFKEKTDYSWELFYNDKQQLIEKGRYLDNKVEFIEQWEYRNGKKIIERKIEITANVRNENCTHYEYIGDILVCEKDNYLTSYYKYDENKNLIEKLNICNDGKIFNRHLFIWNKFGLLKEFHENELDDKPKQILLYDYKTTID